MIPCYSNATIFYYSGNENVYNADDVMAIHNNFSQSLKNLNPEIYIKQTDYEPNSNIFATCDRYKIILYRNINFIGGWSKEGQLWVLKDVLLHEYGHIMWYRQNVTSEFWEAIMNFEDENNSNVVFEDFANSFRLYFQENEILKNDFPIKYAAIKELLRRNDKEELLRRHNKK